MTWETQLDAVWRIIEEVPAEEFRAKVDEIVSDPAVPEPIREFQRACADDSTGRSDLAVPGYRRALDAGLTGYERRRAVIQLASSLRNLDESSQSLELLSAQETTVGDGLDDAVIVFRALALCDLGREREAAAQLIHALADHLPRYTASAHRYADALLPF